MLALSALLAAAAQPPAALATPPTAVILDRNRADRAPAAAVAPPLADNAEVRRGLTRVEATATGVAIRGIDFAGARVPPNVGEAASVFVGKPATATVLGQLAKAMSDAYGKSEVALYTVLVPNQSLAGGIVTIRVIEGFVEQVRFKGRITPLLRSYGIALTRIRPLTRVVMERYISLMRDIPGIVVDIQILRGTRPGAVVFQIDAKRKRKDISISFDNQGVAGLGDAQLHGEAHFYSLLRDGDRTDIVGLATPTTSRLRYVSASHTTPIGHGGATATASIGYIRTKPRRSQVTGDARTAGLSASMPIIRGYRRNLSATMSLDGIDSDAALLGTVFSSDHTRAGRFALGYSDVTARSVLTAGVTLSRGLDILGARGTPGFTDPVFTKVNARITYDRQLAKRLFGRVRLAGQYSDDRLAGAERFAVGGQDFGRAFDTALLSGDRGIAGAGEFAWRPKLPARIDGTEFYAFADKAALKVVERYPYLPASFDLASAGGGIRLNYTRNASIELEAARMIDRPYPSYTGGDWRVNVGWRLALSKK